MKNPEDNSPPPTSLKSKDKKIQDNIVISIHLDVQPIPFLITKHYVQFN